ncbi:unnamed protein product [Vitrella brassicaformis CCMP3155]|uniref:CCHC-type domain-containing protein n=2 Tax=Vitrella brassicaformis TaxID=1169539 RepID=A0A0G4G8C4_VITBC|nr:unnamed protein product [Vitrella brassicaformis CCMP3155]|eukprot:CEM24777.1 unnamed protein product [Vitrella brassicaformis CCMP3155]
MPPSHQDQQQRPAVHGKAGNGSISGPRNSLFPADAIADISPSSFGNLNHSNNEATTTASPRHADAAMGAELFFLDTEATDNNYEKEREVPWWERRDARDGVIYDDQWSREEESALREELWSVNKWEGGMREGNRYWGESSSSKGGQKKMEVVRQYARLAGAFCVYCGGLHDDSRCGKRWRRCGACYGPAHPSPEECPLHRGGAFCRRCNSTTHGTHCPLIVTYDPPLDTQSADGDSPLHADLTCLVCGAKGHIVCGNTTTTATATASSRDRDSRRQLVWCCSCGDDGHTSAECSHTMTYEESVRERERRERERRDNYRQRPAYNDDYDRPWHRPRRRWRDDESVSEDDDSQDDHRYRSRGKRSRRESIWMEDGWDGREQQWWRHSRSSRWGSSRRRSRSRSRNRSRRRFDMGY